MGLLLSVIFAYAGANEALESIRFILAGMVHEDQPDFELIVQHYSQLLNQSQQSSNNNDWTKQTGQGYLCLLDDKDGKLKSAAIKYFGGEGSDSAALLFSTKISSFGQESLDSRTSNDHNERTPERYTSSTKTIIPQTDRSISIGKNSKSSTQSYEQLSDQILSSGDSFEHNEEDSEDKSDSREKLTWHYRPKSPMPTTNLPEIHFQSSDQEEQNESQQPDEFLRSLDGLKSHPIQRDSRRRRFKERNSSSSTSSRDSRASREEELRAFTSLEEAEFENVNRNMEIENNTKLTTRSHSRSRSNSKEPKPNDHWSLEASVEEESPAVDKPLLKNLPKLNSFEEEKDVALPEKSETEVNNDDGDDESDFWGNNDSW